MWIVDGCSLMISSMRYFKIISLSCSLTCPSAIVFKVRCYLMVIFIWLVVPEQVLPLLSRLNPSSQLQRWLPNRFLQLCWQFPLLPAHSFISIREKKFDKITEISLRWALNPILYSIIYQQKYLCKIYW